MVELPENTARSATAVLTVAVLAHRLGLRRIGMNDAKRSERRPTRIRAARPRCSGRDFSVSPKPAMSNVLILDGAVTVTNQIA